ncbi:MAG: 4Fe-4S cluster-binding domain-containing protein [Treponema sp.]|nr:4Fe-4S cluster-binding domain-containing protein [Treponema sp.]
MKKSHSFLPTEIIFSCTTVCNLHCKHCFVNRAPRKIEIEDAVNFLNNCKGTSIEKIGFSGGEPFLYMDFLCQVTKTAINCDFMFDQIMTNGDWWKDESDLRATLQKLYDTGYDGKIGLSWDSYHGQSKDRMMTFIRTVQQIFGEDSVNIQTVLDEGESLPLARTSLLTTPSAGDTPATPPVYTLQRSFPSDDAHAWQYKKWFREDYCEGPGHILYVHADGNIAPCCGFSNENPSLFIGNIKQDFQTILQNAAQNRMVKLCYEEGLSHFRRHGLKKLLKAKGKKLPKGKCGDICSFCDFVCKSL